MPTQNFTSSIVIGKSPEEVFAAINKVGDWWSLNVKGETQKVNDEFETRFGDVHYSRQRIMESIPGKKIVWLVTDSELTFLSQKDEWTGTEIIFELEARGDDTLLRFTHVGLVPDIECYSACSPAWGKYMQYSLRPLIESGKGQPGFPPSGPLASIG